MTQNIVTLFGKKTIKPVPSQEQVIDIHFTSVISTDMESNGNIYLRNNLRIDGAHFGNIKKVEGFPGKVIVLIAEGGKVEGLIEADIIIIDGTMDGTTRATQDLYIRGTAKGEAFYGKEIDVTGTLAAHLSKMSLHDIPSEEVEDEAPRPVSKENVHLLHKKATT